MRVRLSIELVRPGTVVDLAPRTVDFPGPANRIATDRYRRKLARNILETSGLGRFSSRQPAAGVRRLQFGHQQPVPSLEIAGPVKYCSSDTGLVTLLPNTPHGRGQDLVRTDERPLALAGPCFWQVRGCFRMGSCRTREETRRKAMLSEGLVQRFSGILDVSAETFRGFACGKGHHGRDKQKKDGFQDAAPSKIISFLYCRIRKRKDGSMAAFPTKVV